MFGLGPLELIIVALVIGAIVTAAVAFSGKPREPRS